MNNEMVKLTSLWVGQDKHGEPYYSGPMGDGKLMIFKNPYKEKENQPDLNVFISKRIKKEVNEVNEAN